MYLMLKHLKWSPATVYGSVYDHWVVLLFNEISNTYYGWPLSRRNFDAFVNNKYENPGAAHHYEITQSSGNQSVKINVMSTVAGATAVSNLEYEAAIQDKKKQLEFSNLEYLGQFKAEFQELNILMTINIFDDLDKLQGAQAQEDVIFQPGTFRVSMATITSW